jgi:hypothetical protein
MSPTRTHYPVTNIFGLEEKIVIFWVFIVQTKSDKKISMKLFLLELLRFSHACTFVYTIGFDFFGFLGGFNVTFSKHLYHGDQF